MKFIIRIFAVGLVLAGLAAAPARQRFQVSASTQYRAAADAMPIPVCPPNDPGACNIDKW